MGILGVYPKNHGFKGRGLEWFKLKCLVGYPNSSCSLSRILVDRRDVVGLAATAAAVR